MTSFVTLTGVFQVLTAVFLLASFVPAVIFQTYSRMAVWLVYGVSSSMISISQAMAFQRPLSTKTTARRGEWGQAPRARPGRGPPAPRDNGGLAGSSCHTPGVNDGH